MSSWARLCSVASARAWSAISASLPLLQRLVERAPARLLERIARVDPDVLRHSRHLVLRHVGDVARAGAADALVLPRPRRVAAVDRRLAGHPAPLRDAAGPVHPGVPEVHVARLLVAALPGAAATTREAA